MLTDEWVRLHDGSTERWFEPAWAESPDTEMSRFSLVPPRRGQPGAPPPEAAPFVERKPSSPRIDTEVVAAADISAFLPESAQTPRSGVTVRPLVFDQVYADHAVFVWRILRGMGVAEPLVEDAMQDVFMVVHRRLGEFDGLGSVKTWLFQIAFRTACGYRRKLRRAGEHEPFEDRVEARTRNPAEEAERRETLTIIAGLLDGLDDDKRAVLVLADIEEMTAPEIAVVMGTPLNTVYSRLRRARSELGHALRVSQRRGR
jgi:RNA polymerase sigma-70 factor (ECF subfamily)